MGAFCAVRIIWCGSLSGRDFLIWQNIKVYSKMRSFSKSCTKNRTTFSGETLVKTDWILRKIVVKYGHKDRSKKRPSIHGFMGSRNELWHGAPSSALVWAASAKTWFMPLSAPIWWSTWPTCSSLIPCLWRCCPSSAWWCTSAAIVWQMNSITMCWLCCGARNPVPPVNKERS